MVVACPSCWKTVQSKQRLESSRTAAAKSRQLHSEPGQRQPPTRAYNSKDATANLLTEIRHASRGRSLHVALAQQIVIIAPLLAHDKVPQVSHILPHALKANDSIQPRVTTRRHACLLPPLFHPRSRGILRTGIPICATRRAPPGPLSLMLEPFTMIRLDSSCCCCCVMGNWRPAALASRGGAIARVVLV